MVLLFSFADVVLRQKLGRISSVASTLWSVFSTTVLVDTSGVTGAGPLASKKGEKSIAPVFVVVVVVMPAEGVDVL